MRTDKAILSLAIPSIVSNITVPLQGLVDTAIAGHMGHPRYIGAIAIGSTIFSMVYWVFAFLRMGTSGITAQAFGSLDEAAVRRSLKMSLKMALLAGFLLIVLQYPILKVALWIMGPQEAIATEASRYFYVCIWGAPAMMASFSLTGWFIGCQNTRIPMWTAILQNSTNIAASLFFVYVLKLGIAGLAAGTISGLYAGVVFMILRCKDSLFWQESKKAAMEWGRFFSVNRDIFFRTLCIVSVTVYFTTAGSRQEGHVLEANAVLMQLFIIFSYFMDGFANAGEALSGRFAGAGDNVSLRKTIHSLFLWGGGLALTFSAVYFFFGNLFLQLLTDQQSVRSLATLYLPWAVLVPLVSFSAFVWDGVFIGLTKTRGMLVSMLVAAVMFFILWFTLEHRLGNHALWLAFDGYLLIRGLMQWGIIKKEA